MRKFIYNIGIFIFILLSLVLILLFLPATPSASQSLLFSSIQKDSLLENEVEPRVIFLGGSNVTYGLNSQLVKDSLGLNPINASIHAGVGLKYMLDNVSLYLKKGDVLVLIPEYQQFYGNAAYGMGDLLRIVVEVPSKNTYWLNFNQLVNLSYMLPGYLKSKLKTDSYLKETIPYHYTYKAFNEYGDAVAHWNMDKQPYSVFTDFDAEFNNDVFSQFLSFIKSTSNKGVKVYISYPALESESFDNLKAKISFIENKYTENHLSTLGSPEEFRMSDSLIFDTPYHLTEAGTFKRTEVLIQKLKIRL